MLSYSYRFHGHNSLNYVYKNGTAVRGQYMTIRFVRNVHRKKSRVAVVVSKKVHKGAVGRNRIRRRIYEWFRLNIDEFSAVYDIVCVVSSSETRTLPSQLLQKTLREQTASLFAPTDKK